MIVINSPETIVIHTPKEIEIAKLGYLLLVLRRNFPWLGHDEEANGAEAIDALNDLYQTKTKRLEELTK